MKPPLGAALRARKLRYFRALAGYAEAALARGGALAAFSARCLRGPEDRLFAALGGAMSFQLLRAVTLHDYLSFIRTFRPHLPAPAFLSYSPNYG